MRVPNSKSRLVLTDEPAHFLHNLQKEIEKGDYFQAKIWICWEI